MSHSEKQMEPVHGQDPSTEAWKIIRQRMELRRWAGVNYCKIFILSQWVLITGFNKERLQYLEFQKHFSRKSQSSCRQPREWRGTHTSQTRSYVVMQGQFDEQLAPLRAMRPILSLYLQRRGNLAKVSVFQEQELSGFLRKDWNLEDISHSKKQSSGLLCQCYLSVFP